MFTKLGITSRRELRDVVPDLAAALLPNVIGSNGER